MTESRIPVALRVPGNPPDPVVPDAVPLGRPTLQHILEMGQGMQRRAVRHFVNQLLRDPGVVRSHGAIGIIVHPGLLFELEHGGDGLGQTVTCGDCPMPLENESATVSSKPATSMPSASF